MRIGLPISQPVENAGDNPYSIDLHRAIRRLNRNRRLVLVMYWYLDLPLSEIAVATGSSVDACESRLRRAIADLRRELSSEEMQ